MEQKQRVQAKQSPVRNTSFSREHNQGSVGVMESTLEIHYFLWKRYVLGDEAFLRMQPESIRYKDINGNWQRYTPDGAYSENKINYVDEVKYLKESLTEKNQLKFEILKAIYKDKLIVFRVVTEIEIRVGHRIDNIKQLYPAKLHPAPIVN